VSNVRYLIPLTLVVLSYATPRYERAETPVGFSAGPGLSAVYQRSSDVDGYWFSRVNAFARYGFSSRFSLLVEGSCARLGSRWDYEIGVGAKLRAWRHGALGISTGTPLLELSYLHDFSQNLSGNLQLGIRGGGLGVTYSVRPLPHVTLYGAGNVSVPPLAVSFGLAAGVSRQ
jgi:hypothetical protein